MTRLTFARRAAVIPALTVVAVAAFIASGCGGDTSTNGLEKMSAAQVQLKAAAALKSAESAHVSGTSVIDGNRVGLDLRFDGASTSGALTAEGVKIGITRIRDSIYIHASRQGLRKLGASGATQRVGADRWLKLGPDQLSEWKGFSLADIAGRLTKNETPLDPAVAQALVDGKRVVVVSQRDGSKLYVANTGVAYPLRGDYEGGRLDFTQYDAEFHIAAPRNVVDLSKRAD